MNYEHFKQTKTIEQISVWYKNEAKVLLFRKLLEFLDIARSPVSDNMSSFWHAKMA